MNKKLTFVDFLPSLFSLICAVGVMTVFSACGKKADGSWMRCHYAQTLAFIVSLVLLAVTLVPAFFSSKVLKTVFYAVGVAGSVVLFLVPGVIKPMCKTMTMRCYTIMQPSVRIVSVLVLLSCVALIVRAFVKKAE